MVFAETRVLFEQFNEPVGVDNHVPTIKAEINFSLKSGQEFTFARVYVQTCGPAMPLGWVNRIEFNGKTLGSISYGPFSGGCQELDLPVSEIIKNGKNELKIHIDERLQSFDVLIYADLFYKLNTEEAPNDVSVSDPEKEGDFDDFKTVGIIIGGVGIAAVAIYGLSQANRFLRR